MKGNNNTSVYSEEQAINITIEHGFTGNEFDTKVWKERQCLKPDRTLNALIDKLLTIYNNVQVTGSGKKRKYILTDKKDKQTKRQYNYKGSTLSEEEIIMQEYIFNNLVNDKPINHSYKGWSIVLGFIDPDKFNIEDMKQTIKQLHTNLSMLYNPTEIVSQFIHTINTRNKDIIENSFKRLQKENRIMINESYHVKCIDLTYSEISKDTYLNYLQYIQDYLKSKNITYFRYTQAISSIHKTKQMINVINQVREHLQDNYGIDYIFKTFKPVITDKTIRQEITKEQFNNAYYQRLIKLTSDRQMKQDYLNSLSFWKRFYLLNTLSLLEHLKVMGIHKLISEEMKQYNNKVDEYNLDIIMDNFIEDQEKERKRHIFGNN